MLTDIGKKANVISRIYGLGGMDFYVEDALKAVRNRLNFQNVL